MDAKGQASDAEDREVIDVVSAQPMAEAPISEITEAVPGFVVASTTVVDSSAPEEPPPHKNGKLKTALECMLFVSTEPLSSKQLAESLEMEEAAVEEAILSLEEDLENGHGLQLMKVAGGFQLCTRPEYADYCAMVLQASKRKLSKAALETLAVVAYRQPCTLAEIEAVRGVCVDGVIKTLVERALVKEAGRRQAPGHPILYATTPEFLQHFGLNDISELPDIDMLAVEEVRALEARRETLRGPSDSTDSEAETVDH